MLMLYEHLPQLAGVVCCLKAASILNRARLRATVSGIGTLDRRGTREDDATVVVEKLGESLADQAERGMIISVVAPEGGGAIERCVSCVPTSTALRMSCAMSACSPS